MSCFVVCFANAILLSKKQRVVLLQYYLSTAWFIQEDFRDHSKPLWPLNSFQVVSESRGSLRYMSYISYIYIYNKKRTVRHQNQSKQ